jgi:hypothetical protein
VSKYHFKNYPGPAPDPHKRAREERERGDGEAGRRGKEKGWDGKVREGSILPNKILRLQHCPWLMINWFESLTILAVLAAFVMSYAHKVFMRMRAQTHLHSVRGACINILCR